MHIIKRNDEYKTRYVNKVLNLSARVISFTKVC